MEKLKERAKRLFGENADLFRIAVMALGLTVAIVVVIVYALLFAPLSPSSSPSADIPHMSPTGA